MSVSKGKCYLKRKRFLNEVSQEILTTLQHIYIMRNEIVSDSTIKENAQKYAQEIEAACLTPKYKMSNDEYHNVLVLKTQELCDALKRNMLPIQSSSLSMTANQQQQPIQQTLQDNEIDSCSFNDNANKIKNNDINDQVLYLQDNIYDKQVHPEVLANCQQLSALNQSQTSKKTKNRKNNVKSSIGSRLNANQRLTSSSTVQYQPKAYNNTSVRRNNRSNKDNQQQYYFSSIGGDVTNKNYLNCNNYGPDLNTYEEISSTMGDIAELQKNCGIEIITDRTAYQNGSTFLQMQWQHQFHANEVDRASSLRYDLERGNNDTATIFSVSAKDADLFPVTESNFRTADAFSFPEESLFDNNCLKEGLEFSDQISFNFM